MKIQTINSGYEERYCAFIDFLGFKEIVKAGLWSPDQIVAAMAKAKQTCGGQDDIQVTQFSDSLVLSTTTDDEWAFVSLAITSFFLIVELVQHGILLRGGIARGELYHKKNIAFGPAFIRAFELEQAAGTPRVILEPGLAEHAKWPESMDEIEINGFLNRTLPEDADGWRYIDYFSPEHVDSFDGGDVGLMKHYQILWALVKKYENPESPSIRTKYGWVKGKLNKIHGATG